MKRHAVIPGWMSIVVVTVFSVIAARALAGGAEKVPERGEIETKYLWATGNIFRTVDAWETEFAAVEKEMEALAKFKDIKEQSIPV